VSALSFQYHRGGIYLPALHLWLDPREPQMGADRVFVSHAHSDHIGAHREVILSEPTARLMQARLGGQRLEHVLPFCKPTAFKANGVPWQITLLPAGHILGSAMSLIESNGESLLYTGDFKLRRGLSAESCEPAHSDTLIMETTYGRPEYRFPPTDEVLKGVIRFCREAIDNDETPVLLGYSLGKSQELLRGLTDAGLPILLHKSVCELTRIYEQLGQTFPPYERFDGKASTGKVLICPPISNPAATLRKIGRVRTSVLTGWAVDPNCRFRYQTDAAFPLSDHADFPELVEFVKRVGPRHVYTLHGFAGDFAQTLREMGFDAQALSEEEQLTLPLGSAGGPRPQQLRPPNPLQNQEGPNALAAAADRDGPRSEQSRLPGEGGVAPRDRTFHTFAETCAAIGAVNGKLEKVRLLAEYLHSLGGEALAWVTTWFTGYPFPPSQNKVLQLGGASITDALCAVGQLTRAELRQIYIKHSDGGETAFEVLARNPAPTPTLSAESVHQFFERVHAARGPSSKLPLLIEALRNCTPLEGKFFIKILTGDLRIGLKEGLVEEAMARAFDASLEEIKRANLLLGDVGETARLAQRRELASARLVPFRPMKFMLASAEESAEATWDRVTWTPVKATNNPPPPPPKRGAEERKFASLEGPGVGSPGLSISAKPIGDTVERVSARSSAVWLEDKYDGIRCQLHKVGERVALYSRDLKEITDTFLDIVAGARHLPGNLILDGEMLAMRGEQVLPFADLQKRLGRREGDLFLGEEVPVRYIAFDLLWRDGRSLLDEPLKVRRELLESMAPLPTGFGLARITEAKSPEDIEAAFTAARARGNEGLMVKDPASAYSPGRRGLAWLKLKKALATLDCVVVGAEYGHGKRKSVLSDYTFAVRDDATGELKTIGKAYTGLTDAEIAELTQHFLRKTIRQQGRFHEVEPDTVLEIAFDRIQASTRHGSGLAMRFPRIVRIRTDKTPAEIDTVASARKLVPQ
jgi:ATP-dependent DNA ligase I